MRVAVPAPIPFLPHPDNTHTHTHTQHSDTTTQTHKEGLWTVQETTAIVYLNGARGPIKALCQLVGDHFVWVRCLLEDGD